MHPNPTSRQAPTVLTVTEVMDLLRIGRTKAYEQARLFLDTNGADGLPCVRVGDSIRFPATPSKPFSANPSPGPSTTSPTPTHHRTPLLSAPPPPRTTPNSSPPDRTPAPCKTRH